jgi:serine/threonine-protein kinase
MTLRKISHFEIKETLGAGGMGIVYKAYDTKLNRFVAIKALASHIAHNTEYRKRFLIEARAAAALNHPNIATIYETLEHENDAYIVMEFIEGEELSKKIPGGKIKVPEAIDYTIQIAEGLKSAHQNGIVHRDIKSQNIIVTGSNLVKIMDFGLAKLAGQSMMTQMGTTIGTINYMSPEQTRGDEIDQRTDLWALGVVLYEMLTGKSPFRGEYDQAIIYSILNEEPTPVSEIDKDIPKDVDEVLKNLLSKRPENRYQNANELLADLKAIKQSLETGIPVEQIKSSVSTAEYINKLKQEKAASSVFSRKSIIIVPVVIVLLFLILLFKSGDILNLFGTGSLSSERHIVVLPFTNVDNNPDDQAFVDGLMETLTNKVSDLEQFADKLWVVPASDVRASKITSAKEAYNQFGVNLVISGSVEKLTRGYRVNINLVDAKNLRQIATSETDDPLSSTSYIQDEAIIKVADMLNVELKPANIEYLTAGKTGNAQAYELYLEGLGNYVNSDKAKNLDNAIELFNRAINLDSSFARAYAGLGTALLYKYKKTKELQYIEQAINDCNRAIEINNKLTSVRNILGNIYLETGKNNDAKDEFQKVLQVDPNNYAAYYGRAEAFLNMGMNREAEATYQKAIAVKPGYWYSYNDLGWFYYRQGRYREAAAQFQQVITLTPINHVGYLNLASMYYLLGQKDDAVKMWEKSLKIEPDYVAYSNLAMIYFDEKKYQQAASMYEKVVVLNSKDYRIWGYLAECYYLIPNEKEKSIDANKHALSLAELQLQINPKDPDIISSMAFCYAMLGDLNKSKSMLNELKNLQITNSQTYLNIGMIYEKFFRERETALTWIKKALEGGISVNEIENASELNDLIKDNRFMNLITEVKKKQNNIN